MSRNEQWFGQYITASPGGGRFSAPSIVTFEPISSSVTTAHSCTAVRTAAAAVVEGHQVDPHREDRRVEPGRTIGRRLRRGVEERDAAFVVGGVSSATACRDLRRPPSGSDAATAGAAGRAEATECPIVRRGACTARRGTRAPRRGGARGELCFALLISDLRGRLGAASRKEPSQLEAFFAAQDVCRRRARRLAHRRLRRPCVRTGLPHTVRCQCRLRGLEFSRQRDAEVGMLAAALRDRPTWPLQP